MPPININRAPQGPIFLRMVLSAFSHAASASGAYSDSGFFPASNAVIGRISFGGDFVQLQGLSVPKILTLFIPEILSHPIHSVRDRCNDSAEGSRAFGNWNDDALRENHRALQSGSSSEVNEMPLQHPFEGAVSRLLSGPKRQVVPLSIGSWTAFSVGWFRFSNGL